MSDRLSVMARKGLMAKVSNTVFLVGAAAVAVGGALLLAARKAKAKQKPTKKTAKPGGVAPADAPAPSPLPQPEPTSAPVAESMDRIGMSAAPAVFVAGIQGTTKCKVVMFGPLPSLAQFDPFSATSEDRTKITMDVVTTLSFLKKDGSFAGCLRTTTNLQITYTPKWEKLSIDIQKRNPAQACPGFDTVSPSYTIKPKFQPKIEGGLLSVRGTLLYTDPPCDLDFVNVTMVPTVVSVIVEP